MMRRFTRVSSLLLALLLLAGCTQAGQTEVNIGPEPGTSEEDVSDLYTEKSDLGLVTLEDEAVALSAAPPALPLEWTPVASGAKVKSASKAKIDYSNTKDGYVMVQYTGSTTKRLKTLVKGPTTTYQYNINPGEWTVFPLSDGNGSYTVTVYENVKDTSYSAVVSVSFSAAMTDEFAPFLRPNQYVNYTEAYNTIAKAQELTANAADVLGKVQAVYNYVVTNLTYDKALASSVNTGNKDYLPVLDTVLARKTGICFDYAALMTGMLRSQGVPCKLVVGYSLNQYHAWISVWSEKDGWIDGAVYFDGTSWQRMDPTFASSGKQSDRIMKLIGDGKNYSSKYFY